MPKNFNRHDNIDYQVVEVGKDTLLLKLRECEKYAGLPNETITYASMALSFFAAVFFTESTRGLGPVSGETIEATFLVGGVVCTIMALNKGYKWCSIKDRHSPQSIIDGLISKTEEKAIALLPAPKTTQRQPQKQSLKVKAVIRK